MIARHKKKGLFSRCSFIYVQMIWLVIYSAIISTIYLTLTVKKTNMIKDIDELWSYTTRQMIWGNGIANNLRLTEGYNYTTIVNVDLLMFQNILESNFLNPSSKFETKRLKTKLMDLGPSIYEVYFAVYEGNLC